MTATTDRPTTDARTSGLPGWHPLSDRGRVAKLTLLVGALVALGVGLAWRMDRMVVDVSEMQADPAAYDGHTVALGNFEVVALDGDSAELWCPWTTVTLRSPPAEFAVGDAVSVRGTFHADDTVTAEIWKVHRRLKIKKVIGLAALLVVIGLAGWDLTAWRRARA